MILPATLLALAAPAEKRVALPMPALDALALFKRVCADTYPDPARFAAAIAAEPDRFRRSDFMCGAPSGPTGSYISDRAEVNYSAADDLPQPLPSRMCGVLTRSATAVDHVALAAAMTAALSLPAGTTRVAATTPDGQRVVTQWTKPGSNAGVNYLLITRSEAGGKSFSSMALHGAGSGR